MFKSKTITTTPLICFVNATVAYGAGAQALMVYRRSRQQFGYNRAAGSAISSSQMTKRWSQRPPGRGPAEAMRERGRF